MGYYRGMEALILSLMLFIAQATGLPVPAERPAIEFTTVQELWATVRDEPYDPEGIQPVAMYDTGTDTIWLLARWDRRELRDRATLLHELVHFMQDQAGKTYRCHEKMEKEAYDTVRAWIEGQGYDFYAVTRIDALVLVLVTSCRRGR